MFLGATPHHYRNFDRDSEQDEFIESQRKALSTPQQEKAA
jgi:hypothetical protein